MISASLIETHVKIESISKGLLSIEYHTIVVVQQSREKKPLPVTKTKNFDRSCISIDDSDRIRIL